MRDGQAALQPAWTCIRAAKNALGHVLYIRKACRGENLERPGGAHATGADQRDRRRLVALDGLFHLRNESLYAASVMDRDCTGARGHAGLTPFPRRAHVDYRHGPRNGRRPGIGRGDRAFSGTCIGARPQREGQQCADRKEERKWPDGPWNGHSVAFLVNDDGLNRNYGGNGALIHVFQEILTAALRSPKLHA